MLSRRRIFPQADAVVLTLLTKPRIAVAPRTETQFEILVRHLLDRFFNNDMISVGGDTVPLIMTVAYAIALPTVVMSIFAYPFYHAFPPRPHVPPFWFQVNDHYFFVMYSFVAMGAVTVFEWDLLFPTVLDIFVLSPLPISNRRLLLARLSAVLIFLVLFLVGTSSLGIVFFPAITELPGIRLFVAHFVAVSASGAFAASFLLASQGVLINILGARLFRMVSTFIQSLSMTVLLTVLFLFPLLSRSLERLINSGSPAVRSFPPFWFLGIYESVLAGQSRLPVFASLAKTGCWATLLVMLLATVTYPLAYRRRKRQVIEGAVAQDTRSRFMQPLCSLLHATVLRTPSRRAVYHFIGQTMLRTERHRVYLAMYAGLGISLITACAVVFRIEPGHLGVSFSAYGIRLAVPVLAFWTVSGLRTALGSPADPGGSWVFRVIHGRAASDHLVAVRTWVLAWGLVITLGAVAVFHFIAPPQLRGVRETLGQILVAAGLCLLLRATAILIVAAHVAMHFVSARMVANQADRSGFEEEDDFLQILGLRG